MSDKWFWFNDRDMLAEALFDVERRIDKNADEADFLNILMDYRNVLKAYGPTLDRTSAAEKVVEMARYLLRSCNLVHPMSEDGFVKLREALAEYDAQPSADGETK